jgi:hypothetical protein
VQEVQVAEQTVAQDTRVTVAELLVVVADMAQVDQAGCFRPTEAVAVAVVAFVEVVVAVAM